jgi:hypothetical protein
MTVEIDSRDRVFQLWAYTVSMGRLLLRSTKSDQFGTRVDVLFQNVQALQLPSLLSGLVVSAADAAVSENITRNTGLLPDHEHRFFSVVGSNFNGYVVAGVVVSCEDDREYFEPSDVWPSDPGHLS